MMTLRTIEPLLRRLAREVLVEVLDEPTIHEVIRLAFLDYEAQRPTLPKEPAIGGQVMVHLAALTIGFYRALVSQGHSPEQSRELTGGVTETVYSKMSVFPTQLSKLGVRSPKGRVRRATNLFRRFPFGPPSYEMVDVTHGDAVAFDVRRCPVAEHFRAHGLGEVCVATWCNLDYALAERWGARLERTKTLAGGDTHCDFRWHVESTRAEAKS